MHEIFERVLGELRNMWRFRWYAMLVFWVVALLGWAFVYTMPNQYRSSARVHVDTASLLRPLLKGLAIQPNLNQEVRLLTRTLLSRPNLEEIARKSNLDLGGLSTHQKSQLLDGLRHSITIRDVGTDLYLISAVNKNPDTAKSVVQQVLNVMMSSALGSSQQNSTQAQSFLNEQVPTTRACSIRHSRAWQASSASTSGCCPRAVATISVSSSLRKPTVSR